MICKSRILLATLLCIPCLAIAQPAPMAPVGASAPTAAPAEPPSGGTPHGIRMHDMPPGAGPMEGAPMQLPAPPWLHGIQLSDGQEDKVFALLYGQMPALREQLKTLRRSDDELRKLSFGEKYDEARAKALTDAIGRANASLALARTTTDHRILVLLTPEQREQVSRNLARPPQAPHDASEPPAPERRP